MNKRFVTGFFIFVFALVAILGVNVMAAPTDYWTDSNNYDISWYIEGNSLYTVSTVEQLAGLAVLNNGLDGMTAVDFTGKTINLSSNIVASAHLWTPIGDSYKKFTGIFDGQNHTITGLQTTDTSKNEQGLFGWSIGEIKNVGLVEGSVAGRACVGGVVGRIDSGTITNCYNTGAVTGGDMTGGIVGVVAFGPNATISNCYNTGTVMGAIGTGGIVGHSNNIITITSCYNTGAVSGTSFVGGVIGNSSGTTETITNCYSVGAITGNLLFGGIAGTYSGSNVTNNYYYGCAQGKGSGNGDPSGITQFVKLTPDTILVGGVATISQQTAISELGNDFLINYTYSEPSIATINETTVTGTVVGSENITGVMTITQNGLTAAGFTGATTSIQVPISLPLTVSISNACDITNVAVPENATINELNITKTVDNSVASLTIDATASENAVWKLYSDLECTDEITDKLMNLNVGANTAYIKVTAQDSTTKTYTLAITRLPDPTLGTWQEVGIAATSFAGGSGTQEDPYTIATAGQLAYLGKAVKEGESFAGKYVKIANGVTKIDLAGHEWIAIGDNFSEEPTAFMGTFDGNNAEITNMAISGGQSQVRGLFAFIGPGGCIKNIKFTDVSITVEKIGEYVGCAAAVSIGGTISNISVAGSIIGENISIDNGDALSIGGIVSIVLPEDKSNLGLIEKCASNVNIHVSTSLIDARIFSGGITAMIETHSTVRNCYNRGNIYIKNESTQDYDCIAGGITGANSSYDTVEYCYNTGVITAINASEDTKGYIGQIVGRNDGRVRSCFYDSDIVGNVGINVIGNYDESSEYIEDLYPKTTAQMKVQSTYNTGLVNAENVWDFTNVWVISNANDGYPTFKGAYTPPAPSGGSHGGGSSPAPTPSGVDVIVNGKTQTAATSETQTVGNKTTTIITVDDNKINQKLEQEGKNAIVMIPVNTKSDVVVGELNAQTVKNMEEKEAVLEIKTQNVTYTLPAAQINIDNVSKQIGSQVELKDIKVSVRIAEPSAETAKIVENTANKNNYQVVVKPVDFEIKCTNAGKSVDVSKFNGYVERTVAIPDGIDPSKITTGIVLNADGTFSHVPTTIIAINGKYYAKINSLTNSTYSVIYSPKTFKDVEMHWSKDAVNDMASRLVIKGIDQDSFEPDKDITRAEFATIAVKGLGLMRAGVGQNTFSDVQKDSWYYDAVTIANEYKLINGYDLNTFGPDKKITREETMAIISRAMALTKLNTKLSATEVEKEIGKFTDNSSISDYAKESIAACVRNEVVIGANSNIIAKANITRAEVATIVKRLLQKAKLI